jgi:plastocyanin
MHIHLSPRLVTAACYLGVLTASAPASDISGHILITKKLTRKHVTPVTYNLRGVSPTAADFVNAQPVNEFNRVVVFLEGENAGAEDPKRLELVQKNRRFDPEMVVVPVGSSISFPNSDPVFHNVFSLSKTKEFDLGYYPSGQTRLVKFDQSGVVQVYCHLHPNMYAAIVVVPNRWHARPSDDGSFSWQDVPPGRYRVIAWHMSAGAFRKEIQVPENGLADVVIKVPVQEQESSR